MPQNSQLAGPHNTCAHCGALSDFESSYAKGGHPEDDRPLPAAAHALKLVKDFTPYGSRQLQLRQCPHCLTYYLYKSDYEFLVNGTEDEEYLTRLTPAAAQEFLDKPAP